MSGRVVHIVGAGIAGLSAALDLVESGHEVVIHEAAPAAGGRCRSYHDQALDLRIDNGNHLLLSGNHAAIDYVRRIGSLATLQGPRSAAFDFADLRSGERWRLRLNDGRVPWWVLVPGRGVPGSALRDYLSPLRLFRAPASATVAQAMTGSGALYERLWRPLLLAALNTDPTEGSASLAAAVFRETLGAGGRACRPMIASQGLSTSFIDPALACLAARDATISYGERLRAIRFDGGRAVELDFGAGRGISLDADAVLLLAVPPSSARELLPGLDAPEDSRAIVNAHFRRSAPPEHPLILGVINGLTEWLFAYPEYLSVTISAADRLLDRPREELARDIWREVATLTGLAEDLPPWQIVKERRATFAATPAQEARRPSARTACANIVLAGDWTRTGLPASIEGAVRSGYNAASIIKGMGALAPRSRVAMDVPP
jgi:hydroxysqualene dehydroxylase